MENFTFLNPTKIIFGKGTETKVGQETARISKKILLHFGGNSAKKTGLYDRVVKSLKDAGVDYVELGGVKPNPRLSLVREGIKICRENKIGLILAMGGGSVIDSAKAIALGVPYSGDVWDFFTGKAEPKETTPIGVILTIPAAGSESSTGTVITNEDGWFKRPCNTLLNYPCFAILNPELAFTLPKFQIACGVTDIMAHLMERYFTNERHVELTDRLIEATLKTVINNSPLVMEKQDDYDAWAEIMWSGTVAHNNLLNTGREGNWSSHDIEHEVSGIYDIAHGAGLAIVFPAYLKYVYKHDIPRFAQFAVRVWGVEYSYWDPERTALDGIRRLEEFSHSVGLPTTLTGAGIKDDRRMEMAEKCTSNETGQIGSYVKLEKKDVYNILTLAK